VATETVQESSDGGLQPKCGWQRRAVESKINFFFLDGGALLGGATGSRGRRELQTERHRGKEKNARAIH
jgi:hypothetical protein